MILYFSGTGNSEYIAKNIAHLNNDIIVDMALYIRENKTLEVYSDNPYLVVAPVYISTMPTIVTSLLEKAKLDGNKNIYFIMTCAGNSGSATASFMQPLVEKKGMIYRGCEHLSMPQNYLMFFEMKSKDENEAKMSAAIEKVPALAENIRNNEDFNMGKVGFMHKASIKPVIWLFDTFFIKPKKFYATDECINCGLCARVCPLANIEMVDGKPKWNKTCVHCTACINKCPKKAIEYGKKTQGKNRYVAVKFKAD